jgi:hypothetical protein
MIMKLRNQPYAPKWGRGERKKGSHKFFGPVLSLGRGPDDLMLSLKSEVEEHGT